MTPYLYSDTDTLLHEKSFQVYGLLFYFRVIVCLYVNIKSVCMRLSGAKSGESHIEPHKNDYRALKKEVTEVTPFPKALTFDGFCFIIILEAIKRYLRCLMVAQRKQKLFQ